MSAVSTAWNMPKPRPAMKVMIIQAVMVGPDPRQQERERR